MSKSKVLLLIIFALPLLAFSILLAILDNPETYQSTLKNSFKKQSGLELDIKGNVSWRYWPPIAIEIEGVHIKQPMAAVSIASLERANIDIQILPLITQGKLLVEEIHLEGLNLNAIIDKEGKGNWEVTEKTNEKTENSNTPTSSDEKNKTVLNISEIVIKDANLSYQDHRDNSHYKLAVESFTSNGLKPNQAAHVKMKLIAEDVSAKSKNTMAIEGDITFNTLFEQFDLENFSINNISSLPDKSNLESNLKLNVYLDTKKGTAEIENSTLSISTLSLIYSAKIKNLSDTPAIEGKVSSETFDARPLAKVFGIELPKMQNETALSKVSFSAEIKGSASAMALNNISAQIDESTFEGKLSTKLSTKQGSKVDLTYNFHMDSINLSDYMEAPTAANNTTNTANGSQAVIMDSEVIPLSILKESNLNGSFTLDSLQYDQYQFDKISVETLSQDGGFRLNAKASGYAGEFATQILLRDINGKAEPRGKSTVIVKDINLALLTGFESLTGTLAMDSSTTFTGNMLSEVISTLDGKSNFKIADGTLNIQSIKGLANIVEGIQGKPSRVSTWPDQLPFKLLQGQHEFNEGIIEEQIFSFDMENMSINGSGGIDYFANTVNYSIETTLKENVRGEYTVSKNLAGIRWPIHCEGNMDSSPTELCLANQTAITKIVAEVAKQAVIRKGEDKLLEKVPDEFKDAAKQLLKGLFN